MLMACADTYKKNHTQYSEIVLKMIYAFSLVQSTLNILVYDLSPLLCLSSEWGYMPYHGTSGISSIL